MNFVLDPKKQEIAVDDMDLDLDTTADAADFVSIHPDVFSAWQSVIAVYVDYFSDEVRKKRSLLALTEKISIEGEELIIFVDPRPELPLLTLRIPRGMWQFNGDSKCE